MAQLISRISSNSRSSKILTELIKNNKIVVLSDEESNEINRNIQKKFIEIRQEYLARERRAMRTVKSSTN
jgi:thermostable 8-oxoguanine DNA glycosylase